MSTSPHPANASRKLRADRVAVACGLADSRSRAAALIVAGAVVQVGCESRIDKPGMLLPADTALRLKEQPLPYVSRGGLKLKAALTHAQVDVKGKVGLDVGASTGGFTDCLLQAGAKKVYAVDVGYNQLAWSLRQDSRVVVHERCNIRSAPAGMIEEAVDVVVMDVSFISLRLVLMPALQYAKTDAMVVALVKPQFEVGPTDVGKGGIVRDPTARARALQDIVAVAQAQGVGNIQTLASPILGAKGNAEFLLIGRLQRA